MQIALTLIDPNPHQPRLRFDPDALVALAESMAEEGLVHPVLVETAADGRYTLIAGERRFRAAGLNGWLTIEATVRPAQDKDGRFMAAAMENILRADMNPVEEGRVYRYMINVLGMPKAEICRRTKRAEATVDNFLAWLDMPEEIQDMLAGGDVPRDPRVRLALADLPPDAAVALAEQLRGKKAITAWTNAARRMKERLADTAVITVEDIPLTDRKAVKQALASNVAPALALGRDRAGRTPRADEKVDLTAVRNGAQAACASCPRGQMMPDITEPAWFVVAGKQQRVCDDCQFNGLPDQLSFCVNCPVVKLVEAIMKGGKRN